MCVISVWGIDGNSAEVYQAVFAPALLNPWPPRLLALAAPQTGERVLDVACGTGLLTRHAAQAVGPNGRVVGLDISPDMLAVARREPAPAGGAPIEWREGQADALPYVDGDFDIVTCELGLMFFPDRVAALREMRRVLTRDGRMVLMTWGPLDACPGHAAMADAWSRFFGAEQGAKFQPMHSLHDPEEVRGLLATAECARIDVRKEAGQVRFPSPAALVCSFGALAGLQADTATRDALCAEVAGLLQIHCNPGGLEYPIEAVLASARRDDT